ncbi:MAG: twin-arginine translocase subunit TatC [Deltaproteobacteria bacterium]|nr:twin-arginine translocase subunit TatC [Deltaproteobacteria bacterium]
MTTDLKMPLTSHLEELRWRLVKSFVAIAIGFGISYNYSDALFNLLAAPLLSINPAAGGGEDKVHLIGTGVVEAFFTKLKVSAIAGLFLALPIVLFQLWKFVAPGLYEHEKRYALPFVIFGTFFFLSGAWFCYAMVLPVGYRFFMEQYSTININPEIRISEYLTFTSRMLLSFGVTFEMPVVTFFLARAGAVTHRTMLGYLRYAILIIFIVAAVLTPGPDVASQLLMAGPLLFLYGVSILVAYLFARTPSTPADSEASSDDSSTDLTAN